MRGEFRPATSRRPIQRSFCTFTRHIIELGRIAVILHAKGYVVIASASEAIHSHKARMDCFVAYAPRNDG
jgi:hypothetical protein